MYSCESHERNVRKNGQCDTTAIHFGTKSTLSGEAFGASPGSLMSSFTRSLTESRTASTSEVVIGS